MNKYHSRPEAIDGVILLHEIKQPSAREIIQIPDIFKQTDSLSPLEISVGDCRDLSLDNPRKQFILTSITTRVLNACLGFPDDREDWLRSSDIVSYDYEQGKSHEAIAYTNLMRAVETFAGLRQRMDGKSHLIEKTGYGTGHIAHYRIAPDIIFADQRVINNSKVQQ